MMAVSVVPTSEAYSVDGGNAFIELRDRLLADALPRDGHLGEPPTPRRERALASLARGAHFNWAIDYFDRIAAGNDRPALKGGGRRRPRRDVELRRALAPLQSSGQFPGLEGHRPGPSCSHHAGHVTALWETMLATIKLGAVMIPATTLLQRSDLEDRLDRGQARGRHRCVTDRAVREPAGARCEWPSAVPRRDGVLTRTASARKRYFEPARRRRPSR